MTEPEVFVFPASFGQERLWLLHELGAGAAYHVAGALRLTGAVDETVLRHSLQLLVDRHEALRTGIELDQDGTVVQVAVSALPLPWRTGEVSEAELDEAIRTVLEEPFTLAAPPLLRAVLLRVRGAGHQVLVLCVHHIVVDGWSLGILMAELGHAYAALVTGDTPALPEPDMQYADFAVWQRHQLTDQIRADQLGYWRRALAAAVPLELTTDHPAAEAGSYRGDSVRTVIPAAQLTRLREVASAQSATSFMVYVAAWAIVLSRWSGSTDVVIGTPVAGRPSAELDAVVGFFVNTLPLRVRLDPLGSLRDLLRHTRTTCLDAFAHQDVPFEQIKQAMDTPARPGAAVPQTLLGLQNTPGGPLQLPGVTVEQLPIRRAAAQFDLSLDLAETGAAGGDLAVELVFRTDLFPRRSAIRLLEGFRTVLRAFTGDLGAAVWTVPVMSSDQRSALLRGLGTAADGSTTGPDVVAWFETTVDRQPDTVAIVVDHDEQTLTYRELDTRANQLARWLRARGVGPEQHVGVCLPRSAPLAVAVLGILKAGAVYLPLDPDYPDGRLTAMVAAGRPSVVLTTADLRARVPATDAVVAALDEHASNLAALPGERVCVSLPGSSAAYTVFTSGSTGHPKGAVNTRVGLSNRLQSLRARFALGPTDVAVQKTPIGFDVSLPELLGPLVAGARLVFAAPGGHRDPEYLWELFARRGITSTHFVPSMLRAFVDAAPADPRVALRDVQCSGEELTAGLGRDLFALLPDIRLHNTYGPAETAVEVTHCQVAPADHGRVSLGTALAGAQLYVLDRFGEPVPIGVPGELYIGGVAAGRGYLGQPGLTAERFVPNPFDSGTRLYATGDRVRWTQTGELEFLGRFDLQVKIRGQRIEPGEIEAVLRGHPAVADAVVLVRPDQSGQPALVGYWTTPPAAPTPAAAAELRAHLAARLPAAMVPARWVPLTAFPVTPNGKVDRSALPPPRLDRPARPVVAPRTPLETTLARLWSEILGVSDISVQDDFYELGGDSLRAMNMLRRTRQLGLRIPLPVLLGHHTVEHLASLELHSPDMRPE